MGLLSKIRDGLKKTRNGMSASVVSMLGSFTRIDEDLFEELEEILVSGDVGVPTAERICGELKKSVRENHITDPGQITGMLKKSIADILRGGEELNLSTRPSVVLVAGVNGVGKTTTVGKLSALLGKQGKKVLIGAADTFRAAAVEQLDVWAKRSGAEMVSQPQGSDAASVVFDSIAAAKARKADVVLLDTAGRLHNKKNLMEELAKIDRVIRREAPGAARENLLVLDAATGQNAINQARDFEAVLPLTGIVLTKLDGTPRGGVILAIRQELDLPIKFIGVGEKADDLQPFDADEFAEALFEGGRE